MPKFETEMPEITRRVTREAYYIKSFTNEGRWFATSGSWPTAQEAAQAAVNGAEAFKDLHLVIVKVTEIVEEEFNIAEAFRVA